MIAILPTTKVACAGQFNDSSTNSACENDGKETIWKEGERDKRKGRRQYLMLLMANKIW
jgi:hypothetical protein